MTGQIGVHNEWGKLKEVIVGIVPNKMIIPPISYSMGKYVVPEVQAMMRQCQGKDAWVIMPEEAAATQKQIDDLAAFYKKHGVKVHRSRPWSAAEETYLADVQPGGAPLYVRDPILVAGKNVIELSIMSPYRRKEIFAIRDILERKVGEDPEARYVAMPLAPLREPEVNKPEGPGPFLEGGDIFVMGQDVLVGNSGLASNAAGIAWLRRYLSPQGFRVHEVQLADCWLHLDCVFAVVRRGLAMADLSAFKNGLPEVIRNWKVIPVDRREAHGLGCNTVCLEENVVMIGEEHERIIGELKKEGADIVATPMHTASLWGGGIRCATHPLLREE